MFGVPYAANEQIKGCAGRSDVFFGTLEFSTNTPAKGLTDKNVLVPIVIKKPEYMANNLNNYNSIATDTLGKTVKTYSFYVPKDVTDGQIVLITSNHGANASGEEYNRRWHYVYITGKDEAGKFKDRELVLISRGVLVVNLSGNIIHKVTEFMVGQSSLMRLGNPLVIGVPVMLLTIGL